MENDMKWFIIWYLFGLFPFVVEIFRGKENLKVKDLIYIMFLSLLGIINFSAWVVWLIDYSKIFSKILNFEIIKFKKNI
jgi:hypothetical protein